MLTPREQETSEESPYRGADKLRTVMERLARGEGAEATHERMEVFLKEYCERALGGDGRGEGERREADWWTSEVAERRKSCIKARRTLLRARAKVPMPTNTDELARQFKEERGKYKRAIKAAKEMRWQEILEDLDRDIWGDVYKIVCKWVGWLRRARPDAEVVDRIMGELFPVAATTEPSVTVEEGEGLESVTKEELERAI